MEYSNRKEVISFRKRITAGQTVGFSERVKAAGTVEGVKVKFYVGQEKSLQVYPYIEHKGRKYESLITYPEGTDNYLSGDDEDNTYDVVVPVDNDDYVKVNVTNTSAYDYDLSCDISIDYYGGKNRIVGGGVRA